MPHDYFGPEIAADYDADDGRFAVEHLALETSFLADLAGSGGRALEFAIGTGRVALPLRERGVDVHGIDLSTAMIEQLRAKPGGQDVPVTVGDYTTATADAPFDLVYLVFNTIGNVITQDAQVATFANAARHLRPGGAFVVETSVVGVARSERFQVFRHDDAGVGYDEFDHATQRMWSHHITLRPDGSYRRNSVPFRYAAPAEYDLMARLGGMTLRERWAWWDRTPFTAASPAHVSVWTRD